MPLQSRASLSAGARPQLRHPLSETQLHDASAQPISRRSAAPSSTRSFSLPTKPIRQQLLSASGRRIEVRLDCGTTGGCVLSSVLVIDDSTAARSEIRSALSHHFTTVLEAADGLIGLRMLLAERVDAIVCDLEMPGLDGEKLLHAQRSRPETRDVPFFFLTAQRDPDRMARLLRAGASDTIQKPFHPAELLARLETHLRLRRLQAELREKNGMLERISTTDSVTGLRTRRYVGECLAIEVLRATRYMTPLAIAMCDLDHFKRINDSYGHLVGDAVLEGAGDVILDTLRATDVAGRYGGEEFLLVLPNTGIAGGGALAERVRAAIETRSFAVGAGAAPRVTVSIGVAVLGDGQQTESLIAAADAALYQAKGSGRNRIAVAGATSLALDSPKRQTKTHSRSRSPR